MKKVTIIILSLFIHNTYSNTIKASSIPQVGSFIVEMANKHNFNKKELDILFDNIFLTIKKPTKKTSKKHHKTKWFNFRKMFLTKQRINSGAQFLRDNYQTLEAAEKQFGVQKAIIVAIIGIETNYGKKTGNYPVMKTLTALAFGKNNRQSFYKKELEEFLLLVRKNNLAPLALDGSYAGAMGISQFISSSYNYYAVDFNNDGVVDLFNVEDAIGSIANYLSKHYWQKGGLFVKKVGSEYQKFATFSPNKPKITLKKWQNKGVKLTENLNKKVAFIKVYEKDKIQTLATFWNFYVITRYNHDNKYALAAFELATAIIKQVKKI